MAARFAWSLGLSTLLMGGSIAGMTAIATASDRTGPAAEKAAAEQGAKAARALGKHRTDEAIGFAEAAVGLSPRTARYRMVLGQAYLQGGRFASARTAFADVLALTPDDGKAALDLALAQIATGDWDSARKTLDAHATIIPVGDLGLAVALAGDPAGAVGILTTAARQPGADAKVRQNLALALALTGQWNVARVVASADLSPADVDARIEQWAVFAQPRSAADQVAALLGVTPTADAGLPIALALNGSVPVAAAADVAGRSGMPASAAPATMADARAQAPTPATGTAPAAPAPVAVAASAPTHVAAAPIQPLLAKVVFSPPREVVQALPVAMIRPAAAPMKVAPVKVAPAKVAASAGAPVARSGDWVVQLGAYRSAGVAKDGWTRVAQRFAGLHGHAPTGTNFTGKAGTFYRLSVGGFARADADRLCGGIRARGGACFVRRSAGDQMAQWLRKPGVQLASR